MTRTDGQLLEGGPGVGPEPARAEDGERRGRLGAWALWLLSIALTLAAGYVLWKLPEARGAPGAPVPARGGLRLRFPTGSMADLARIVITLRLTGLLIAPAGRPLPPFRWLASRLPSLFGDGARGPDPAPWRTVALRVDLPIALFLLGLTAVARYLGWQQINPDFLPYGSDWATFMQDARAARAGDWAQYNGDKWPLYPWFAGWLGVMAGGDYAKGCQIASWLSLTLAAPALYFALRLALGRGTAIGGALLFAFAGLFQSYANQATSYGFFTALTLVLATAAAWTLWSGRLVAWGATGVALGLLLLTEVKTITVATPVVMLLVIRLLCPGRSRLERLVGPLLVALPALALHGILYTLPVRFSPLETKLQIQAADTVRFMNPDRVFHSVGEAAQYLPPLADRVRFSLGQARELAPHQWQAVLLLAALGLAAPLLARGRFGARARVVGLSGTLFAAGFVASTFGAFTWLFLHKYIVHALPFLLALAVHGAFLLAAWLTPRGAPVLLRHAMAGTAIGILTLTSLPLDGLRDPDAWTKAGVLERFYGSLPRLEQAQARGAWQVAWWLEAQAPADAALLLCTDEKVIAFLKRRTPADDDPRGPKETCRTLLEQPPARARLWVVDTRSERQMRDHLAREPARFRPVYAARLDTYNGDWLEVYLEEPAPGASAAPTTTVSPAVPMP